MIKQKSENFNIFPLIYHPSSTPITSFQQIKVQQPDKPLQNQQPFQQLGPSDKKFSPSQIQLIVDLYLEHGSKWTIFSEKLNHKSSRQIKNFFYNRLRKLAKNLCAAQKQKKLCQKKMISVMNLHCLLDTSLMIRKYSKIQSEDLSIFKIQREVLNYSFFHTSTVKPEQLLKLAKNVRQLKLLLKNIKIRKPFLSKYKVNKLSQKFLQQQNWQIIKTQCAKQQEDKLQPFQIKTEQIQNIIQFLKHHEEKVKKQQNQ